MQLETPEDWLPVLTYRLDLQQPIIFGLRQFVNGDAPLPEMGKNTRATWIAFQREARTNFGAIACQSHANRIRVRGVRVGADDQSSESLTARRIARDNGLSRVIGDAVWDMLSARTGYLLVSDDGGRAVLTAEQPEQFYAEPDPLRSWRARAAIKVWRDTVQGVDFAVVWVNGNRQSFSRTSTINSSSVDRVVRMTNSGGWEVAGAPEPFTGSVPVWIFQRRDGMGLIEPHLDILNRINRVKLARLSITAIQAFKQRALTKEPGARLPEKDEAGNPIDWAKVFEPAPGALWDLPAGINIWESGQTDIRPLLDAEKADARDFAAATGTPISMLQPDSQNQSAAGASATTDQQVESCRDDIENIKPAAAAAMVTALLIEGVDVAGQTVEVDFEKPEASTLAEKMDAYSKAIAAGMSVSVAQKEFLSWSQTQIDEDEQSRRRDAARSLMNALAAQPPQPVPASASNG